MSKGPGVQKMFDAIAGRYDMMNRVMTLGQDQKWRKFVVKKTDVSRGGWVLDLATGTGDIAALMLEQWDGVKPVGADFSIGMLEEARKRFGEKSIAWQSCDANRLPFFDGIFEAVTFGYLLRNVDDSLRVLREVHRVMKPGGRVVCLDTTPPERNLLYPFLRFYFRFCIPILGRMIANDESAYAYLTCSTMEFHRADELAELFYEAGFSRVGFKKFMFGTIAIHWGEK